MSSPAEPLAFITGYGVTTALGGNTAQSCAALRAGIPAFAPTDRHLCFGIDPEAEDLEEPLAARVPQVEAMIKGTDRLLSLVFPALVEAVRSAKLERGELASAGYHFVLPQPSRPGPGDLEKTFLAEFFRRAALPDPVLTTLSRSGHAGFGEALRDAVAFLQKGESDTSVIVCVDSMVDGPALKWLDEADRLKCSRSPEGVIAGEAAAVLVLRRPDPYRRNQNGIRAVVESIGMAHEPNNVFSEDVCIGAGLTEAVRAAVEGVPAPPTPPWVVLDHTGERYRAAEWSYVIMRLHEVFRDLRDTWFLADCIGDTGAAAGGLAAARVMAAFERDYAPGDRAWVILGSDDGDRSAVILGRPPKA